MEIYMRHLTVFLTLMSLASTFSACGQKDDKDQEKSGQTPLSLSPFEQLSTEWTGIYRALEDGKPMGDASGCRVVFSQDGTFSIKLDEDASAKVEGQWSEFQGKTLILRISGSSMPRVGSSGKVIEPSYELLGSSLRVSSQSFELKLTKKSGSVQQPTAPGGTSTFTGAWTCSNTDNRKSKILITESWDFKLSSVRQNERAFVSQGKAGITDAATLKLTPTASSDPLPTGAYFELRQAGIGADFVMISSTGPVVKLGVCKK